MALNPFRIRPRKVICWLGVQCLLLINVLTLPLGVLVRAEVDDEGEDWVDWVVLVLLAVLVGIAFTAGVTTP